MKFVLEKGLGVYFLFLFTLVSSLCYSQMPGIKWQKTFGGTSADNLEYVDTNRTMVPKIHLIDRDGGYIIAGQTSSVNGDIQGNHGGTDIWIAKLDTQRNIIWKVCLGGTGTELIGSVQLAADSGYIVTGSTTSNNGDVSGNHGNYDMWVVRLGNSGNKMWQNCYGGSGSDISTSIATVGNQGYILLGHTSSSNGNVSGLHGQSDLWTVRLDNNGGILWQKCLGGTGIEEGGVIKQIPDNGFIITGITNSNNGDVTGLHGSAIDIWAVKTNETGIIEWQKCLGGSDEEFVGDVEITKSGDYLIAGSTNSTDGDVSGLHESFSSQDAWIVRLSVSGNILWQHCYGSFVSDAFSDILIMPDDSYIATGFTGGASGDVKYNHGYYDCWLVKTDNNGNLIWENTFGGTSLEGAGSVMVNLAGNFLVLGSTYSNDFDVSGNQGNTDLWLFEAGSINMIAGFVFYDSNSDGIKNNGESFFDRVIVSTQKNAIIKSAIPLNGFYRITVDTGTYLTQAIPHSSYYNVVPVTATSTFNSFFNTDSVHFAIQPIPGNRDVTISLFSETPARPGFEVKYRLIYKNAGTNIVNSGNVKLVKDHRLMLLAYGPPPSNTNGDTLTWNFTDLEPLDIATITIYLKVPTPINVNIGDTLHSIAWITHDVSDLSPSDDTALLKQIVTGSYDPNDKNENNGGSITQAYVNSGKYLNYLIRFQNTGTDTAFNVIIRDTLDNKLNWNTLEMVAASHPYLVNIIDQNKIAWTFPDIHLPDSNINEAASHGYIAYRIKPNLGLSPGDVISNSASIYFDFNLPVVTNTVLTEVAGNQALPLTLLDFKGVYKNDITELYWSTTNEYNVQKFEIERSFNGTSYSVIGVKKALNANSGITDYTFTDDLQNAVSQSLIYYRLKMIDIDGKTVYSNVILIRRDQQLLRQIQILPNPVASNTAQVMIPSVANTKGIIRVMDLSGHVLLQQAERLYPGTNSVLIRDLSKLSDGTYLLQVMWEGNSNTKKFIIQ